MPRPSVVDEVVDQLAYRIAAGRYAPGELMPSVRQVAAEFGISAPTANVVLGRLASAGFADARRGLGHTVRDIRLYGGVETWRYVFRFSRQLPDTALKIFSDIIEADQTVLFATLRAILTDPRRYDPAPAGRAIDRLELLASGPDPDLTEVMHAELHALRMILAAAGQVVFLAMFNSIGEMMIEVPEAAGAFYDPVGPERHVLIWHELLRTWQRGVPAGPAEPLAHEPLIAEYHRQVVRRFGELIVNPAPDGRPFRVRAEPLRESRIPSG
ncbi:MAG TPA: GntR family transcriptional regulator [Pseudonocardia sp.]|nr:GntR family transcriptional regulator [Pseudonocardia sp.]